MTMMMMMMIAGTWVRKFPKITTPSMSPKKITNPAVCTATKGEENMMQDFKVKYIPGGMSGAHSAWWLCQTITWRNGSVYDKPLTVLRKADYK